MTAAGSPALDSTDQLCGDGIDLALGVAGRAQGRAVVEVGAPIPLAVPAAALRYSAQVGRLALAAFGEGQIAAQPREFGEALSTS